jgi:hypothetical protein
MAGFAAAWLGHPILFASINPSALALKFGGIIAPNEVEMKSEIRCVLILLQDQITCSRVQITLQLFANWAVNVEPDIDRLWLTLHRDGSNLWCDLSDKSGNPPKGMAIGPMPIRHSTNYPFTIRAQLAIAALLSQRGLRTVTSLSQQNSSSTSTYETTHYEKKPANACCACLNRGKLFNRMFQCTKDYRPD